MKLKESKGMSLIVFTIILVVLLIVAGGVIVYLLNNPVKEGTAIQTPTGIQNNMTNNEIEIYTETDKKDIKETIENYYKLLTAKENSSVLMLTDVMKMTVYAVQDPEYAPDNYVEHPDASKYMWTGIKYEDFRNNLWYVTDNILKEKFSEFVEYKNYLYIENNDNNSYDFKYEITKQEINQSSTIDTCICDVTVKNSKTGKVTDSKITMSRGNGDFVIKEIVDNNKEVITDNNIFDNEYKTLNELALLKISSDKLNKKEEIYEYDFNKDGIKEKLTLKQTEDEYVYSIHYGNQVITDGTYGFRVYVVDLDENDNYLDLILSEISDGGEFTSYYIYKNNGTSLEKLKYTTEKAITGDYEGNNFCLDKNNNFILLGDPEASLDSIVTNTYYSIKNNVINSAKIENIETNKNYKVKKEHVDFTTDYNKTTIEYTAENRYLKVGTELQIIEWLKGPGGQEIIKVKLASGEIGYIYEAYA